MPTSSKLRHVVSNKNLIQWSDGYYQEVTSRQYWQEFGPQLAKECRTSLHSLLAFGQRIGWWTIVLYLASYALVLAGAIVLPLQHLTVWSYQYYGTDTCRPDGTFALSSGFSSDYDLWDVSGVFQITMGFGELSFSNAKLVDAVWDVVSH